MAIFNGLDTEKLNAVDSFGLSVEVLPNISGIIPRIRNFQMVYDGLREKIQNSDAVIARMPTQLGLVATNIALGLGKPVAMDIGGCVLDDMRAHGALAARVFSPVAFYQMKKAVARVGWASYVTKSYLQSRYPCADNARSIACSNVDLPERDPSVLVTRVASIDSAKTPVVFGTIGSLHGKFKGIHDAIVALGSVASKLPPFEYRVLGGGDASPLKSLAARYGLNERVFFDGTLPAGEKVLQWLDNVDIYMQPSLREGLPRALIEAMSRGCPSLASNVAGIPELLPVSVLHRPGDVVKLSELIVQSIDPVLMRQRAEQNWHMSGEYGQQHLCDIRDQFWGGFAEFSREKVEREVS